MIFSIQKYKMEQQRESMRENARKYFQNKCKREFSREYFENYFENEYFVKGMKLLKLYFVFVAFGVHFICLLARMLLFDWVMYN